MFHLLLFLPENTQESSLDLSGFMEKFGVKIKKGDSFVKDLVHPLKLQRRARIFSWHLEMDPAKVNDFCIAVRKNVSDILMLKCFKVPSFLVPHFPTKIL